MTASTAGYSGKPLATKLGIKPGLRVASIGAPENYAGWIAPMVAEAVQSDSLQPQYDILHYFTTSAAQLQQEFPALRGAIAENGAIWVSWPKRSSKVATDLDENLIREMGLAAGLVDVKVAAVDEAWSVLKFVIRLRDRARTV